jgi:hypothetical protein
MNEAQPPRANLYRRLGSPFEFAYRKLRGRFGAAISTY